MSDEAYERARERVKEKKKFYKNLSSFLVMSVFFFVLNAVTSFGAWWFYWPILGWGIGIAMHYFKVFGFPGVGPADEEWERREMDREMRRLEGSPQANEEEDTLDLPEIEKRKEPKWRDEDLV